MGIVTQRYIRKPLYVEAVLITSENFEEIAVWCEGELKVEDQPREGSEVCQRFIKFDAHIPKTPRQKRAYVGDWMLYTEQGFKVYTARAFNNAFDLAPEAEQPNPAQEKIAAFDALPATTPQGEPLEVVPATSQSIMQAVQENEAARSVVPQVSDQELAAAILEHPEGQAILGQPVTTPRTSGSPSAPPVRSSSTVPPVQTVENVPNQEKIAPAAAEGKRVLSVEEQHQMTSNEIRERIQSGEVVLAQDIAQA